MEFSLTKNKSLLLAAIFAILFLLLILSMNHSPKEKKSLSITIPDADPTKNYIVDLYEDGRPIRRQEGLGSQVFDFKSIDAETVSIVVTDPAGNMWTTGNMEVETWDSGELTWTDITDVNPAPITTFFAKEVLEDGRVIVLPKDIEVEVGNALHVNPCCTVLAVFPCRNNENCARVDCNMYLYETSEITLFEQISDCLMYDLSSPPGEQPGAEAPELPEVPLGASPVCLGERGDFNGDNELTVNDTGNLVMILGYIQEYGKSPNGVSIECADVNDDGTITLADYMCLEGTIDGVYKNSSECPFCTPTSEFEICHDGVDNDCDGQTDRETYNNGEFYGSSDDPVDVCNCSELTPCGWIYDVDGIEGITEESDTKHCVSISGLNNGEYRWYSKEESMCNPERENWILNSKCYCDEYICAKTEQMWSWKDPYHFGFLGGPGPDIGAFEDFGLKWSRPHVGPFVWNKIETTPGNYNWSEVDSFVRMGQEQNISILATIWPFAEWDQENWDSSDCTLPGFEDQLITSRCMPYDMDAYKIFVEALVERYDGDGYNDMPSLECPIRYWETLNEPELGSLEDVGLAFFSGTADEYVQVLEATYEAIKSADNDAIVLNGGATGSYRDYGRVYWSEVLGLNGDLYFDIGNFHSGDGADLDFYWFDLFYLQGNAFQAGGLEGIWVTEFDIDLKGETEEDEAAQAREIVMWCVERLTPGMDKVFYTFYSLSDDSNIPITTLAPKTLIYNGYKRQSYYAFKTMVNKLEGFIKSEELAENTHKFYVGNDVVYVIWYYQGEGDLSQIQNELSGQVIVTDMLGNATMMDISEVTINENPIYIESAS